MKVLMIFQTSPQPPDLGPSKRNVPFFLENLKRHEVSVLSFGTVQEHRQFAKQYGSQCKHIVFVNNDRPRIVNLFLRVWRFISGKSSAHWLSNPKMEVALQEILQKEQFDIIHAGTTLFGYYNLPVNIPLVGDTHNVEYHNLFRTYEQTKNPVLKLYRYIDYKRLKREETAANNRFDVILSTTRVDRDRLLGDLPHKEIHAVCNGVESVFFIPQPVEEEPKTIVFAGLMSYYPNYHGIMYFLDEIFPLIVKREPAARLMIVGANPPSRLKAREAENITVTGWVDDVKPYFARGQVFVIPLLIGGGIRGKALEAMAMKRPIVTTTIGCEGINIKHEESVLFADTPAEFANAVLRMFNDGPLRQRLTEEAHQVVLKEHNWEANGITLDRIYRSVLASKRRNGSADHQTNSVESHHTSIAR